MINLYISRDINNNKILFQKMKENLENKVESYYFVPDQYTLFSDINLIENLDLDIIMDVKVKSFSSFSNEILSTHGGLKKKVLTENGKNMIIKKLLLNNKSELKILAKNVNLKGYVSEISKSISNLKDAGISVEKLRESVEKIEGEKSKLEDLIFIYEKYEDIIKDKYIDTNDKFNVLYEKLDLANELIEKEFFFDRFNILCTQELEIISKLNEMGVNLNFFLVLDPKIAEFESVDYVEDGEIFDGSFNLFNKLRSLSKNVNIISLPMNLVNEHGLITQNLFSYKAKSYDLVPKKTILTECKTTEDEVKLVCEMIMEKVIKENYSFKDFAIITTNEMQYNRFIKRIFTAEKIPFFIDTKKALLENKLASYLINILMLFYRNFKAHDIVSFLKFGTQGISYEEIEIFEKYLISRKINGNMIFDDKYFDLNPQFMKSLKENELENKLEELKIVNKVRDIFISLVENLYLASKEKNTIKNHIKALFSFLLSPPIKLAISDFIESQSDNERLNSSNQQVWDYFIGTIDELTDLQGDDNTSFVNFVGILIAGFEEETIGIIPPYQDVVFVGSTKRTRMNNTKIVFILGLNDNYFPSVRNSSDIINEKERLLLNTSGLELPSKDEEFKSEELMNLYTNLFKACEKLIFSMSYSDSSNTSLTKSIYFKQLEKIFPNIRKLDSVIYLKEVKYSKYLNKKKLIEKLSCYQANFINSLNEFEKSYLSKLIEEHDRDIIAGFEKYIPRTRILEDDIVNRLYTSNAISVSRVESYAKCPYKHFISYGIKPEQKNDYDIEKREIGNLAHKTLYNYVRDFQKNPIKFKNMDELQFKEEIYKYLNDGSMEMIDETRFSNKKNTVILKIAKKSIFTGIKNVNRQLLLSEFTPALAEAKFGKGQIIPPLIIDLGDRQIELEGIIDRIDTLEHDNRTDLIVIDYKTGSKTFDLSFAVNGIDVQLPVYLKAATEAIKDSRPAGFFYLPVKEIYIGTEEVDKELIYKELFKKLALDGLVIDDEDILKALDTEIDNNSTVIKFAGRKKNYIDKDNVFSESQINDFLEDIFKTVSDNIEGIYSGNIDPYPYIYNQNSECNYCEYMSMCKFELEKNKFYRPIQEVNWKDYKND